jgi:glutamate--cysteine ligase
MRFLDVFLLHCLLSDSPPDSPEEIVALAHNQHSVAERGREPGLLLERGTGSGSGIVTLKDWGLELVAQLGPIAQKLDAAHGSTDYSTAVQAAMHGLQHPETLPSVRVLHAITEQFDGSFGAFARAQSVLTRQAMLDMPWPAETQARFEALARESWDAQRRIEAADTMPFDIYLQEYLSHKRLGVARAA